MDVLVWGGVIIVYLLNLFFKKSSEGSGRANEESTYGDKKPSNEAFDEIRREILRKKKEREGLKEAEVERTIEVNKAPESQTVSITTEADEPSQFQVHLEEQSQRIKEKQEEAERLKIHLEQMNNRCMTEAVIGGHASNNRAIFTRDKVRTILVKNSNIKAALIAGEILSQPLALRTEIKKP